MKKNIKKNIILEDLNERGVSLVFFSIALVPILILAMLVIDGGYLITRKVHLESAMDTASLRATQALYDLGAEFVADNWNNARGRAETTARRLVRAQLITVGFSNAEADNIANNLIFDFEDLSVPAENLVSYAVTVSTNYQQDVFFVPIAINQNTSEMPVSAQSTSMYCDFEPITPNVVLLADTSCSLDLESPNAADYVVGPELPQDQRTGFRGYDHIVAGLQDFVDTIEEGRVLTILAYDLGVRVIAQNIIIRDDPEEVEYVHIEPGIQREPVPISTRDFAKFQIAKLRYDVGGDAFHLDDEDFSRLCRTHTANGITVASKYMQEMKDFVADPTNGAPFGPAYAAQQIYALTLISDGGPTNRHVHVDFTSETEDFRNLQGGSAVGFYEDRFAERGMSSYVTHSGFNTQQELLNAIHQANLPIGQGYTQVAANIDGDNDGNSDIGAFDLNEGGCEFSFPRERFAQGNFDWGDSYAVLAANYFKSIHQDVPILSLFASQGFDETFTIPTSRIFRSIANVSVNDDELLANIPCNGVVLNDPNTLQNGDPDVADAEEFIGRENLAAPNGGFALVDVEDNQGIAAAIAGLFPQNFRDRPPLRVDQRRQCVRAVAPPFAR